MRRLSLPMACAMLITLLYACDDFSLLDEFYPPGSAGLLVLNAQRIEVERFASIALYPSGGTPPYSYEVFEDQLFYPGSTACQASAANDTFTAGDSVGGVLVRLRDAAGKSAEMRITLLPPAPEGFFVIGNGSNRIDLSWSLAGPLSAIGGFMIERATDGGAFQEIIPLRGSNETSYSDGPLVPSGNYTYRMRSVAGIYRSAPTAELSAIPNS